MSINVVKDFASKNPKFIKYYPSLKSSIQSDKAILITEILEKWFKVDKLRNGFYKFLEPCDHPLYRKGDSWIEELGCVRISFNRAFDQIGIRYKSKSAFLKEADTFKGKLYASYYDRISKKTFYLRNHEAVNDLFNSLQNTKFKSVGQGTESNTTHSKTAEKNYPQSSLPSELNVRYERGTIGGNIYNNLKPKDYYKSNSLRKEQGLEKNDSRLSSLAKGLALKMIEIWKQEIGDTCLRFSSTTVLQMLHSCLEEKFESSLFKWQEYCQMINSSKFFMGEGYGKNFTKPYLLWAVKDATIEKIFNGMYSLGDRETNLDHEITLLKAEIQTLSDKKYRLEGEKQSLKFDLERERGSKARNHVELLTTEELDIHRLKFKEDLRSRGEQFATLDEDNDACKKILDVMFDRYLINLMEGKIYDISIEGDQLYIEKNTEYEKRLSEVENKLTMLNITLGGLNQKKQRIFIKSQFDKEQDWDKAIVTKRIGESCQDFHQSD